jgi:hypothetical protein
MARIQPMTELQLRKQALVAESDVLRELLAMEVEDLRIYGTRWRRRWNLVEAARPWLALAPVVPLLLQSLRPKKSASKRMPGWRRFLAMGLMGWRFYRKFSPLLRQMLAAQRAAAVAQAEGEMGEEQVPSAGV